MPSETTLNTKNLAALEAERLAELLLEVTAGDVAAKRQLRLELTSRGGDDVASEIRKRLVSITKSRSSSTGARSRNSPVTSRRSARRLPLMLRRQRARAAPSACCHARAASDDRSLARCRQVQALRPCRPPSKDMRASCPPDRRFCRALRPRRVCGEPQAASRTEEWLLGCMSASLSRRRKRRAA